MVLAQGVVRKEILDEWSGRAKTGRRGKRRKELRGIQCRREGRQIDGDLPYGYPYLLRFPDSLPPPQKENDKI
jgi:hypothetical protein